VKTEDYEVEATGEVELEDKVLVLKRIEVRYRLKIPEDKHEVAERVHEVHHRSCPVARSIGAAVDISTRLELRAP
jgi:uncharacterized OsmC-like protein